MLELIGFRAVQGLGAGGLIIRALAIVGDESKVEVSSHDLSNDDE